MSQVNNAFGKLLFKYKDVSVYGIQLESTGQKVGVKFVTSYGKREKQ